MHKKRQIADIIYKRLEYFPVVALLGPRQCGKTTLAKEIISNIPNSIYLDLEKISDLAKLEEPWAFFEFNKNKLICLDEIQLKPQIFSQIRSFVDQQNTNGQFLILGSASRDLIKQSSQSLAGRIAFTELSPFQLKEILLNNSNQKNVFLDLWLKGGFPKSYLSDDIDNSVVWRENYIKTFLERDLPQVGFRIPSSVLNRFWTMCAHCHGQILNASKLGTSLGVSNHTIKNYFHILEETFMIRLLPPFFKNTKKRMIKSPKIYIRDSGIVHTLLQIEDFNNLLGHPIYGFSYEGFVIENLINHYPKHQAFFYRTAKGNEIDLVLIKGLEILAFEIKASSAPKLEAGFYSAIKDLKPTRVTIIAQVKEQYPLKDNIFVKSLEEEIKGN